MISLVQYSDNSSLELVNDKLEEELIDEEEDVSDSSKDSCG